MTAMRVSKQASVSWMAAEWVSRPALLLRTTCLCCRERVSLFLLHGRFVGGQADLYLLNDGYAGEQAGLCFMDGRRMGEQASPSFANDLSLLP